MIFLDRVIIHFLRNYITDFSQGFVKRATASLGGGCPRGVMAAVQVDGGVGHVRQSRPVQRQSRGGGHGGGGGGTGG